MRLLVISGALALASATVFAQDFSEDLCRAGMDGPCVIGARPAAMKACESATDVLSWPHVRVEFQIPEFDPDSSPVSNRDLLQATILKALPPEFGEDVMSFRTFPSNIFMDRWEREQRGWQIGDRVVLSIPMSEVFGIIYQTLEAGQTASGLNREDVYRVEVIRKTDVQIDQIPVYCPEYGVQDLDLASFQGVWAATFTSNSEGDLFDYLTPICPLPETPTVDETGAWVRVIDGKGGLFSTYAVGIKDGAPVAEGTPADGYAWQTSATSYAVEGSVVTNLIPDDFGYAVVVEEKPIGYLLESLGPPTRLARSYYYFYRCDPKRALDQVLETARATIISSSDGTPRGRLARPLHPVTVTRRVDLP